jgi:hypothetical protein
MKQKITFFCVCVVLRFELGLHLEPLHQPYFCEGFFEVGALELFAGAGFKL